MTEPVQSPIPPASTIALVDKDIAALDRVLNGRIDALRELSDAKWHANERALEKAERATEKLFDSIKDKMDDIGARMNRGDGDKSGKSGQASLLIGLGMMAIALVSIMIQLLKPGAIVPVVAHP